MEITAQAGKGRFRPLNPKLIEWLGSLSGLLGAGLLALHNAFSGYGFVAFLVSNVCWIWIAVRSKSHGLLTMQLGFTLTSVIGIRQWFF